MLSFDDRYVASLLGCVDEERRSAFCKTKAMRKLEVLAAFDRANATDYYEFLRCYLVCERKASQVAGIQNMHRNNVSHRVRKIEEMLGVSLDDPHERFSLLLAYQLRDDAFSSVGGRAPRPARESS